MRNFAQKMARLAGAASTKALAIAGGVSLIVTPATANVGNAMNDFFNSSGAAANVTGPTAYQGQSAGYYSGGSVWTRFENRTVNPINLQLPRARGGCGGIDLFSGSFSFINADELVAMLKATANNAIGFAFQLAIDSISAEIGGVMKDMAHRIQSLNQFNMNSCEQAQSLVGALWPQMDGASSTICQQVGQGQGIFSDAARARHGCTNGGQRMSTLNGAADPSGIMENRNFTWDALHSNPSGAPDREYAEFLMTLVGTIIWQKGENENAVGSFKFIPPAGGDILTILLDGSASSPAQILRCDTTERKGCLNPVRSGLNVSATQAFKPRIVAMLTSIEQKIRSNQQLNGNEINLLGMTSIPLYKIMTVNVAAQFGMGRSEMDFIAEAVAYDMLISYTDVMLSEVRRNQTSYQAVASNEFESWRNSVSEVRTELAQRSERIQGRLNYTYQIIERTQMLETSLRNAMTPGMAASLRFGRGLSAQGLRQ